MEHCVLCHLANSTEVRLVVFRHRFIWLKGRHAFCMHGFFTAAVYNPVEGYLVWDFPDSGTQNVKFPSPLAGFLEGPLCAP